MNLNRSFFGIYHPLHKSILLICDLAAIALAFFTAAQVRLNTAPDYISLEYLGINVIVVFSLFIGGAYTSRPVGAAPKLPLKTFFIILGSAIPSTFFVYILGPERFTDLFGRGVFPFAMLLLGILTVMVRVIVNFAFIDQRSRPNVLILGSGDPNDELDTYLSKLLPANIHTTSAYTGPDQFEKHIAEIVIAPSHQASNEEQQLLIERRLAGTPIFALSDFIETHLFLVPVQEIDNNWFIQAEGFAMLNSSIAARIKRGVDIVAALVLSIVTLPISFLAALAIKLTSQGPVFFSQTRVGLHGDEFMLRKFRTMINNAEDGGAQWASNDDPRITAVGRLLRKSRIDELPQCWNILKGEMSIIGPRPERPEFTNSLKQDIPYYDLRHIIKPGLTGWAQVMYPYGASREDALRKLQYDLFYIKNQSLMLDLNILLRTVLVTLQRSGR